METTTLACYIVMFGSVGFLLMLVFLPKVINAHIQRYFTGRNYSLAADFLRKAIRNQKTPASKNYDYKRSSAFSSEFSDLKLQEIFFHDVHDGFPVLTIKLYNTGSETISIKRIKFNINIVGRLKNRVEGHASLSIAQWGYTVQFDPMFEGSSVLVDIASTVTPHSDIQFSFTIGQETSDVETATLYHFNLCLEDVRGRKLISKPMTMAIPSPVKAKSYAMLEERPHVIQQNADTIKIFSLLPGYCNPLAERIIDNHTKRFFEKRARP